MPAAHGARAPGPALRPASVLVPDFEYELRNQDTSVLRRAWFGAALASLALAGALVAHVRLIHSGNGKLLYWQDPSSIRVAISSLGSDDVPGPSDQAAIQGSIASWNRSSGTRARLVEDASASSRARTDWAADDLHLILFDEDGASG